MELKHRIVKATARPTQNTPSVEGSISSISF